MTRKENNDTLFQERKRLVNSSTIRTNEAKQILSKLGIVNAPNMSGNALQCYYAIAWLYGNRATEIARLHTSDIEVRGNSLAITFQILKKNKNKKNTGRKSTLELENLVRPTHTKLITLENRHMHYILDYYDSVRKPGFLFPANTRTGYIYTKYAWEGLRKLKTVGVEQPLWTHLFRHSLATELAKDSDIGVWDMKAWFDWANAITADEYITSAGREIPSISNRK